MKHIKTFDSASIVFEMFENSSVPSPGYFFGVRSREDTSKKTHRLKNEKERKERNEENVKKSVWSKWMSFIRGYWCGRSKEPADSSDVYTRVLNPCVFDIPVEPTSSTNRTMVTIPEHCGDGLDLSESNSCVEEEKKSQEKKEKTLINYHAIIDTNGTTSREFPAVQYKDKQATTGDDAVPTSKLYYCQKLDQIVTSTQFTIPSLWSFNGESRNLNESSQRLMQTATNRIRNQIPKNFDIEVISKSLSEPTWSEKAKIYHQRQVQAETNNLLDQLMYIQQDFYGAQHSEQTEKKTLKFELSSQKRFLQQKISRQVSPRVLVNIKPFKSLLTQSNLGEKNVAVRATASRFDLREIKKTERSMGNPQHPQPEIIEESESFEIHYPVMRDEGPTHRTFWNSKKEDLVLQEEAPTGSSLEDQPADKDYCFIFGIYQSCNADEVFESFDDSNHDVVFKKNIGQFKRKINGGPIGKEDKKLRRDLKPKRRPMPPKKMSMVQVDKILAVYKRPEMTIGILYNLVTEISIIRRGTYIRKPFHVLTTSQIAREIHQLRETLMRVPIQERLPSVNALHILQTREVHVRELKTARTLQKVNYCLTKIDGIGRIEFLRSAPNGNYVMREQPVHADSPDNLANFLRFLQDYTEMVERSFSDREFIEIGKVLSEMIKGFSSLGSHEVESDAASLHINATMQTLTEDQRVLQILNDPLPEYLALVYQRLGPRTCFEKSFSEIDLHKRRRNATPVHSNSSRMENSDDLNERKFIPSFSVDGFRVLYEGMKRYDDKDNETAKRYYSGTKKILEEKNCSLTLPPGEKKMPKFRSNSYPGEMTLATDYRAQRPPDVYNDLHKEFKKKKGLELNRRLNSVHPESERLISVEGHCPEFQKYLSDDINELKRNSVKKMFFVNKNAMLGKEVISVFSTIKDLTEEKKNPKTSLVIMMSKK